MAEEHVKTEPRSSMDYFGLLQVLLARAAFARDKVDFVRPAPDAVKAYVTRLESLVEYLLPAWREELFSGLDYTLEDIKAKYVEGLRLWGNGESRKARELWRETIKLADTIKDKTLTLLSQKGILFHSRKVSVFKYE